MYEEVSRHLHFRKQEYFILALGLRPRFPSKMVKKFCLMKKQIITPSQLFTLI